jgi:hypothetical protein
LHWIALETLKALEPLAGFHIVMEVLVVMSLVFVNIIIGKLYRPFHLAICSQCLHIVWKCWVMIVLVLYESRARPKVTCLPRKEAQLELDRFVCARRRALSHGEA